MVKERINKQAKNHESYERDYTNSADKYQADAKRYAEKKENTLALLAKVDKEAKA